MSILAEVRGALHLTFERRLRVDTDGFVSREELGLAHAEDLWYQPTAWMALALALPRRETSRDDVFIELGAGYWRRSIVDRGACA